MTVHQAKQVWDAVLGELQLQVTRPSYETWLKDTVGIAHHDGEFVVGTPNAFVAEMLEQRMYSLISQATERVIQGRVEVRFQVLPGATTSNGFTGDPPDDFTMSPEATGSSQSANGGGTSHQADGTLPGAANHAAPVLGTRFLNPKYTFDTFIVGKSNELAHAAAVPVSENPGVIYNPLVIYSDSGLGKTHLLHAIGHRVQSRGLSLIYATTEEFTNEYIKAIREGKTEEFRNRYRSADVLLLDDIQFLIGKEQTQEGFFHTFNALHMSNRQIVITCDRPVTALTLLEARVRSRLAGGLVVDIQPPDLETRLAILRAKADLMKAHVAPDIIQFLGERIHKNIRELEGSLNRVLVYSQLTQAPVTLDLVKRAIADFLGSGDRRHISPDSILDAVSLYCNVDKPALKGPRGKKDVALARQIAMYLLKEEADLGPTAIGRILGGKDHSTVVKNCAKIVNQLNVDPHLRRDIINIRDAIANTSSPSRS